MGYARDKQEAILVKTISTCQNILAESIVPDSKKTSNQVINELLDILDNKDLVQIVNDIDISYYRNMI